MRGVIPASTTPGPETSMILPTPSRFTSQPTSSAAPGPYLRGVASIVKMVSLPPFPCMVACLLPLRNATYRSGYPAPPGNIRPAPVSGNLEGTVGTPQPRGEAASGERLVGADGRSPESFAICTTHTTCCV